jgi:tetratricopeptide (TPR) repeat protein
MGAFALAAVAAAALNVPFVPQEKDTCGAAALAMVLAYWGQPVAHDDIAGALLKKELRGIPGSELARFARERGLTATAYKGDLGHLRTFVERGRPLIVAWDMGRGRFHDVVVVGFEGDDVVVNDPARGPSRREDAQTFERRWSGAGHWTLLVAREEAGAAAPPDSYDELVRRGVASGKEGRLDDARDALERAVSLDPARPEALVERGGLRFLAKEYDAAITDFEQALDRRPDAYTREMLATSLFLKGRTTAALREWNRLGQPVVQDVRIVGTKHTEPEWVRREVMPSTGHMLRPKHLEGTRLRLVETGLFRSGEPRPVPLGGGKVDLEVAVVERHGLWDHWAEFAARTAIYAFSQKVRLRYYNLLDSGVTLQSEYKWEKTQPRLMGTLYWARPAGLPFHFYLEGVTARPEYALDGPITLRTQGMAAGIRRVLGSRTVAQLGVRARHRSFSRFRFDSPAGDINGFDAGVERRWLDRPRHRLQSALYFFQATEAFGSDLVYPRALAMARYYGTVAGADDSEMPAAMFATQVQWGAGGTGMPLDDMFAPGAASEMDLPLRGHRQKREGVLGVTPIGRRLVLANAEWRQRVVNHRLVQAGIVLFYDGARISDTAQGPRHSDLHDVGVGLRIRVKGAPILRVDYGWSVNGDGKTALTAGVGHVF